MTCRNTSQPPKEIVALGNMGYQNAASAMMAKINKLSCLVVVWNKTITRLGKFINGENAAVTEKFKENQCEVEKTNLKQHVIGYVLHTEPIVVSDGPSRFTCNWALIQLYDNKNDWDTFQGNKVYIGGNLSPSDFSKLMFSQPQDQAGYEYPDNGLLQAYGVVNEDKIHQPQHLNVHGEKALLVVENGLVTGTTIGRTNGLESYTQVYSHYGIKSMSIETAILPYDKQCGPFSALGDSGSIILNRAGCIIALLPGGSGVTDETDITYGTPYWWLQREIKKTYPDCHLYQVVN